MSEISVTVVYALPDAATEISLRLPEGATVADAIELASIRTLASSGDVFAGPVGIFGKRVRRDAILANGDRVELYRHLSADPKQVRRRRIRDKRR